MDHGNQCSKEQEHGYHIKVNGEKMEVDQRRMSYQDVCRLAFPKGPFGPRVRYTVDYSYPDGREGSMVQGDTVDIVEGMIFYVSNTDRS